MSSNEWPDELNYMHLRRLDMQDGGTRARDFIRRFGVPVKVDGDGKVVDAPVERMAATLQQLNEEAARIVKIN